MAIVSIVVPVYNVETYLKKCINSILSQTFQDFELILVDDGSQDKCGQICDAYEKKSKKIKVIHQENGGLSAARNTGINWVMKHSDSQWITFVDSDDYIKPLYLEVLFNSCINNSADVSICDFDPVDEEGNCLDDNHNFKNEVIADNNRKFNLLYSNWRISPAWGKLYKKKIFSELRYDLNKLHEDEFIIHKILWKANLIAINPENLYCYLIRKSGITGMKSMKIKLDSLEAHILRYYFCKERMLPIDYRLFKRQYIREVLSYSSPDKEENDRCADLKKRYKQIVMQEKKIIGFWNLFREELKKVN